MKMRTITITLLAIAIVGLSGCGGAKLKDDVVPMAETMCKFIEIKNNLKTAREEGDTLNTSKYEAEKQKITDKMTTLNSQFQEKYRDSIPDKTFGERFKLEINKAMLECPHLSEIDRESIEAELNEQPLVQ